MRVLLAATVCWVSLPALAAEFQAQGWALRNGQWNAGNQVVAGDFNDDGRDDLALISASGYCSSNVAVYASSGSSFVYSVWGVGLSSGCASGARWVSGDFNGDRRSDLAAIINDSGQNTVRVFESSGYNIPASYWTYAYRAGGWYAEHQWRSGDFDADGKSDLAAIWQDTGSTTGITVFTTSRYGVVSSVWASRMGGWSSLNKWSSGDFDGNGMSDLAAVWNDFGMNSIGSRISTGVNFIYQDLDFRDGGWGEKNVSLAGDFNGDGFSDLAIAWNDSWMNSISVYASNGQSMRSAPWATRLGGWGDTNKWAAGDFDGDRKTDLSIVWNDGSQNSVAVLLSR
jgi:hypothetical protein